MESLIFGYSNVLLKILFEGMGDFILEEKTFPRGSALKGV